MLSVIIQTRITHFIKCNLKEQPNIIIIWFRWTNLFLKMLDCSFKDNVLHRNIFPLINLCTSIDTKCLVFQSTDCVVRNIDMVLSRRNIYLLCTSSHTFPTFDAPLKRKSTWDTNILIMYLIFQVLYCSLGVKFLFCRSDQHDVTYITVCSPTICCINVVE